MADQDLSLGHVNGSKFFEIIKSLDKKHFLLSEAGYFRDHRGLVEIANLSPENQKGVQEASAHAGCLASLWSNNFDNLTLKDFYNVLQAIERCDIKENLVNARRELELTNPYDEPDGFKAIIFYDEKDVDKAEMIKELFEIVGIVCLDPKNVRLKDMHKFIHQGESIQQFTNYKTILLLSNHFLQGPISPQQSAWEEKWSDHDIYLQLHKELVRNQDGLWPIVIDENFNYDEESAPYKHYNLENIYKLRYDPTNGFDKNFLRDKIETALNSLSVTGNA